MNLNTTTQLLGVAVFFTAAALCCVVWRRLKSTQTIWAWLGVAHFAMAIEVLMGVRHMASEAMRDLLRSINLYQDRVNLQVLVVAALCLGGFILVRRFKATKGARIAISSTSLALLVFLLEAISLHTFEKLLYHPAGPVFLIGWLWAAMATLTAYAALLRTRA